MLEQPVFVSSAFISTLALYVLVVCVRSGISQLETISFAGVKTSPFEGIVSRLVSAGDMPETGSFLSG
jgi:hypothetical protein